MLFRSSSFRRRLACRSFSSRQNRSKSGPSGRNCCMTTRKSASSGCIPMSKTTRTIVSERNKCVRVRVRVRTLHIERKVDQGRVGQITGPLGNDDSVVGLHLTALLTSTIESLDRFSWSARSLSLSLSLSLSGVCSRCFAFVPYHPKQSTRRATDRGSSDRGP